MSYPDYLPEDQVAASDQLCALRDDLAAQESVIERGLESFIEIGRALAKIRDERLYRQEYASFEVYCQNRWNLSRKRAYDLMGAATVVDGMEAALDMAVSPIGDIPALPVNEGQARELTGLDPTEAVDVMAKVNETTNGKPTAAAIRNEIDSRRDDPDPDLDGDVEPRPPVTEYISADQLAELNQGQQREPEQPQPPATTPKRRPITDAFDSANFELRRAVERLVRLAGDDRFTKNKDQIKASNLSDLVRVHDAISGVINQLEG